MTDPISIPTLIRCIGCGLPLGNAREPASKGALDHVRACEKHPIAVELQKTRDVLAMWIAAAKAASDRGLLDEAARADFNAALAAARELPR